MSEVNIPLLRKVVEWVEEQEALTEGRVWYQEAWLADASDEELSSLNDAYVSCGTVYCVAGKIALDAGWRIMHTADGRINDWTVEKDGMQMEVRSVAARELGLEADVLVYDPSTDVERLFEASNSAARVRAVAEDIAGEPL